nr:DMT family transporter [Roseibium sp. RKSG952]
MKGIIWIVQAAFWLSVMYALVKIAGDKFSVFQILFIRQIVMVAVSSPKIIRGLPESLQTRRPGLQALRVILALITLTASFLAYMKLPLPDATTLQFTKAFFTTIFGVIILGEAAGFRRWTAISIGFLGVLLIVKPDEDTLTNPYDLLAIASAASVSLGLILVRIVSKTDHPATTLVFQSAPVGLIVAIPALLTWQPPTLREWALLISIGIVSWAAQTCNIKGFHLGEASVVAPFDYTRLIYAAAFGYLIFGEIIGISTLLGAALICGASLYALKLGKK